MLIIDNNYRTRGDGVVLKRTYSDTNHYIVTAAGIYYNEAVDVPGCPNVYFETPFSIDEYDICGDGIRKKSASDEGEQL